MQSYFEKIREAFAAHPSAFESCQTFSDFVAATGIRWLEANLGADGERCFQTVKRFPDGLLHKPLHLPLARTFSDLFEIARFLPNDPDHRFRPEPGFYFCSGFRAEGVVPSMRVGGTREIRRDASGNPVRTHYGSVFHATYVKPRVELLKAWSASYGSSGTNMPAMFDLAGFDVVDREDGLLVIATCGASIVHAYMALLDRTETVESIMHEADLALIRRERAAEAAAWSVVEVQSGADRTAAPESPEADAERVANARIPVGVLNVLDAAIKSGTTLHLVGQLDKSLYAATKKVIEAAGGKWNRKLQAHIFETDAADAIEQVILSGTVTKKQDFGQFDSPPDVVDRAIELAAIEPGMLVLEPSAGVGNLVRGARAAGGDVLAHEMDPDRFDALSNDLFAGGGIKLGDFLLVEPEPKFDRVVMNPPFSRQADIDHVTHAARFLKPGGRMVAIMAAGTMFRTNSKAVQFRHWVQSLGGSMEELPDGAFRSSGTMVKTCIVTFDMPTEQNHALAA